MERDDLIMAEKKVAVVMGSDSDLGVVRAAIDTLKSLRTGARDQRASDAAGGRRLRIRRA